MQLRGVMVALTLASLTGRAFAEDPDIERANQLFDEGRALVDTDFPAACEKFRASLAISAHAIGTLLNVALCDEREGRYASAHARFSEARDRAREGSSDIERKVAEDHLAALAPKIPRVTLRFVTPPLPGTTIVIGDKVIPFADIANYPLDPGDHEIVVSAPGYLPFKETVSLTAGESRAVDIPELARSVTVRSSRKTIGKITTASGAGMVGAGVVLGLVAKSRYDGSDCTRVGGQLHCNGDQIGRVESALVLGDVGTAVTIAGLVATGVGLYLWLRAPDERREPGVTIVPQVSPETAGLAAVGRF